MTARAGDEARLIAAVLQAFEEAGSDYEQVLDFVCRLGCDLTGDPWIIRLVDDANLLHLAGSAANDVETLADIRQTMHDLTMPYDQSRVASVSPEGAPLLLTPETLAASDHTAPPAIVALAERRGFVGGLLAPMRSRGRVIGVLWWLCRFHRGEHDEDDLRLLATVADRCALAIDNARLLRHIKTERNRHAALLSQVSDAVVVVDADGTIRHATPGGVTRVLGWQPEDLVGMNVFDLVHRKDHEYAIEGFLHALGPDDWQPIVIRGRHRDGTWRHLHVSAQNLIDDDVIGGVVVAAHDVTEQVVAAALLNDENDILERVATGAPLTDTLDAVCRMIDGHIRRGVSTIWLVDDESHVLIPTAGPSAGPLPTIEPEHGHQGVDFVQMLPPDDISVSTPESGIEWEPWREQALAAGVGCSWTRPIRDAHDFVYGAVILYRNAVRGPTDTERTAIELGSRLAAVAVRRARDAEQLAHAATHDAVTNLPNRRLYLERLQQAVARQDRGAPPPSVLFVDLDRFKQVNDLAGHAAGDEVLRLLGARIERVVRPADVVARFGGDEFAVLCDETSEDEAISVAERLLSSICEPVELNGRRHHLSASIGIATGRDGVSHDSLVHRADVAMYRAKSLGSGGIVSFRSGMAESPGGDLEHDLRRAIEGDEIFVHYQPIADIRTGRWAGAEALARWRHRDQGWVPPTTFVALAEEIGMAVRLGDAVLRRVCADAARWSHDPEMRHHALSINVSGRQLADPRFVGSVQRQIDESGVSGNRFIVELTETTMMEEFESAMASVAALRALGMSLAIDDFGTGHSTLARLREFPAIGLKLDRSFIDELGEDSRSADIVAAVVHLAHAVGMAVCAEGVETPEQLAMVQRLGVDLAQGFLLSYPLPPDEVRELMARPPAVQPLLSLEQLPLHFS